MSLCILIKIPITEATYTCLCALEVEKQNKAEPRRFFLLLKPHFAPEGHSHQEHSSVTCRTTKDEYKDLEELHF